MEAGKDPRVGRPHDLFLDHSGKGQAPQAVKRRLTIEVASDVVCPWCYIGKRRLEKALALLKDEVDADVRWLPFQLNPDMPKDGLPRDEYRKAKFGSLEKSKS